MVICFCLPNNTEHNYIRIQEYMNFYLKQIQLVPIKTLQSLHAKYSVINESLEVKFGLHYDNKGLKQGRRHGGGGGGQGGQKPP